MANADTARIPRAGPALSRIPSPALVLGAIGSIQFGAALAATLFGEVGPAGAVTLRLVTAAIILVAIWRPGLRHHTRRELLLAALFGLVLAGMNLSFYEAIHRIPLGIAVTLEMVGPLGVAVGGSRRPGDLVWVALAAVGILALTNGTAGGLDGLGVAFALIAGCLWGLYILVNARVGRAFPGGTGLALAMIVASLVVLPVGIAQAGSHLFALHALAIGVAVGILSSVIPYSLELEALRRIAAPVFGVLMSLEPAVAALAGLVVLDQSLSPRAAVGIGLVVIASVGATRRRGKPVVAV